MENVRMPAKSAVPKTPKTSHNVARTQSDDNYERYYTQIEKIHRHLDTDDAISTEKLAKIQAALDKLADTYGNDKMLGSDRYALLHAQALIYYHENKDPEAIEFMEAAINIRGENYADADNFIKALRGETVVQPTRRNSRINRSTYFLSQVVAGVAYATAAFCIGFLDGYFHGGEELSGFSVVALIIVIVAYFVYALGLILTRMNDLGLSKWWIIAVFVPLLNILVGLQLLFQKGSDQPNSYGPPASKRWGVWGLNA